MKRFSKFLVIALAGVVALGVYSCDNVNMNDIMVTPSSIDVDYSLEAPAPIRIAVNAGHDWFVQSTADWITVDESTISETGFTVRLDAYVGEGTDVRSGIVFVSSKVGQWPVVFNQERLPYSTYEEYLGTYRFQMNQYDFASSVFTPTGNAGDALNVLQDFRSQPISGLNYDRYQFEDPIFTGIAGETYASYSLLDLFFVPEAAALEVSGIQYNIGFGNVITVPAYYESSDDSLYFFFGEELRGTVNPDTKVLEFPNFTENGQPLYWFTFWTLGIPWTDYYYGDMVITMVEAAPAPAQSNAAAAVLEGSKASVPASFDGSAKNAEAKKGI